MGGRGGGGKGGGGGGGGGGRGVKPGQSFSGRHAVWGNVHGTVTAVHGNGSITGQITAASGRTISGVAFSPGEFSPAR